MGKGEIAHYEQFLLFPHCFQKACFPGTSKSVIVWEWVNSSVDSLRLFRDGSIPHFFFCLPCGNDVPLSLTLAPPGWLSGERVGLMTWWLRVRSPVEATFLYGVFSPLTSAEACEKSSRWLWKEKLC